MIDNPKCWKVCNFSKFSYIMQYLDLCWFYVWFCFYAMIVYLY